MHTKAKQDAIKWAQETLEKDFLVCDTETSHFINRGGEVIQLGVIDKAGNVLINQKFKPRQAISPGAMKVHGITDEDVSNCPTWTEKYDEINTIMHNRYVLFYNASFDTSALEATSRIYKLTPIFFWSDCVMEYFAKYYGDWNEKYESWRWQKLTTAAEYFKIEVENAHDAVGDILMTLRVLEAMANGKEA